jgi:hypothetical protein
MHEKSGRRVPTPDPNRPPWQQSETLNTEQIEGYDFVEQQSYRKGEKVPRGTPGSTRPDNYSRMLKLSVEVKNYDVRTKRGLGDMVSDIAAQAAHRALHLPRGTRQALVIDVRGQQLAAGMLDEIRKRIVMRCGSIFDSDNIEFMVD